MARAKMQKGQRQSSADPNDGAQYWKDDAKVEDYLAGPDGLRPGEKTQPAGKMRTSLQTASQIKHMVLPPRSIWEKGEYVTNSFTYEDKESLEAFNTWQVSGEGTPGNYATREYVLPDEISNNPNPPHPKDWKASMFFQKKQQTTKATTTKQSPQSKATVAPSLPFGIRFRDPNCGHWFKESDLAGHAKVCPGTQGGESDWAIACECCESLDETAKCKKGFPRPKPKAKAEAKPKPEPKKPEPETLPATFDPETKPGEPLKEKEAKPDGNGTPAT